MIWEKDKKLRQTEPKNSEHVSSPLSHLEETANLPKSEKAMVETTQKTVTASSLSQTQTSLGRSVTLRGELSGNEDLLIEGQFEGNINVQDHCVTIGSQGQVKADIQARQVVVFGKVDGKISARDKVELRKTGYVVGDLVSAGIAIEEGAYFKGSIEILREGAKIEPQRAVAAAAAAAASLSRV
jgi:cytoskeletal protein CcmA (bactofilin family)